MSDSNKHAKHILYGALWTVGGLIATAASDRFVFWGAVLFGGLEFLGGVVGWLGASSDRQLSRLAEEQVREQLAIAELKDADEYPPLVEAKNLLEQGDHESSAELILEELKTTHKRNKDIFQSLVEQFLELLFGIYKKHNVSCEFDRQAFDSLVRGFRANTEKLLPLIDQHGHDRAMIDSPNFGVNLPQEVVDELTKTHNSSDKIDREILSLIGKLPKLS